jgi:Zn-dependent protease with chaperone function
MHGVCLVKLLYIQVFYQSPKDAGLATVMGHEVSHALANHGAQE